MPEGVQLSEFEVAVHALPSALVIGAIDDGRSVTAYAFHEGVEQRQYVKVYPEKLGYVPGRATQRPVLQFGNVCIGILICRDIEPPEFRASIVGLVRGSSTPKKLICIPADMGDQWFVDAKVGRDFEGVHVLLSNKGRSDGSGCPSLFAGPDGVKLNVVRAGQMLTAEF
jgi:predicted amidohydrolase